MRSSANGAVDNNNTTFVVDDDNNDDHVDDDDDDIGIGFCLQYKFVMLVTRER